MKTMPVPAKHAERYALLRQGFLRSVLGGLLCTVPLSIHAAEFRTDGGRSIPDRELLPEVSDCVEMIREAVSGPMETTGRSTKGEVFLPAAEAVSAYGIQPDPPKSESDENPAEKEIEVRLLVTREKQKTEGARISVVGTDRQTETNAEGLARLFVKPGSTIRITYPGCQPQERKINSTFNAYRQFALINLKPESNTAEAQKTQKTETTNSL